MAIPVFVGAGAGVTITTGTGTVSKTGCIAGNIIIMQVYNDGVTTGVGGRSNVVNVELLNGTDSDMEPIDTSIQVGNTPIVGLSYYYIGRVMANGTCSQDFTVGADGFDVMARAYEFSGVATATTQAAVIQNSASTYLSSADNTTDLRDQDVTTTGSDRLALNFVIVNANQALGDFTGMTGGTWSEAVAEYIGGGTVGTLQLQTASMPVAGTIDGGQQTITANGWGVVGLALTPATAMEIGLTGEPFWS